MNKKKKLKYPLNKSGGAEYAGAMNTAENLGVSGVTEEMFDQTAAQIDRGAKKKEENAVDVEKMSVGPYPVPAQEPIPAQESDMSQHMVRMSSLIDENIDDFKEFFLRYLRPD